MPVCHARIAGAAEEPSKDSLEDMTRLLKLRLGTDARSNTPVATGVEGVYQTRFGNKFAYLIERRALCLYR